MIDLTGQTEIKHSYSFDAEAGTTTVVLYDGADVELGSIKIESARYRSFIESLQNLAKEFFPNATPGQINSRTLANIVENTASTEF